VGLELLHCIRVHAGGITAIKVDKRKGAQLGAEAD
jgi:hypothetical protein